MFILVKSIIFNSLFQFLHILSNIQTIIINNYKELFTGLIDFQIDKNGFFFNTGILQIFCKSHFAQGMNHLIFEFYKAFKKEYVLVHKSECDSFLYFFIILSILFFSLFFQILWIHKVMIISYTRLLLSKMRVLIEKPKKRHTN